MTSLPLLADERLIGAVSLYSCQTVRYEEEHMRLLETITRIAADAIEKSLQHLVTETYALTDPMTGLPNARSLQMQFEKERARADRSNKSFQVVMMDLDGFKFVNDTFGHKAGDRMLKEIGRVIREQLRDYDFLARYAGDEFVALIPDMPDNDVRELCDRIETAVCDFKLDVSPGKFAAVGVSLGASDYPKDGASFDDMIVAADRGMYETKSKRKQLQRREAEKKAAAVSKQEDIHFSVAPDAIVEVASVHDLSTDALVVELDETHIVSSAVN
jgi:diguanylate cyclase (GGDEF)-like protein